jgi:hypothetical protein
MKTIVLAAVLALMGTVATAQTTTCTEWGGTLTCTTTGGGTTVITRCTSWGGTTRCTTTSY